MKEFDAHILVVDDDKGISALVKNILIKIILKPPQLKMQKRPWKKLRL